MHFKSSMGQEVQVALSRPDKTAQASTYRVLTQSIDGAEAFHILFVTHHLISYERAQDYEHLDKTLQRPMSYS